MQDFSQLNIHSYMNQSGRGIQAIRLVEHEELTAQLVTLPPGAEIKLHSHGDAHELFDVVAGEGTFVFADREVPGGPGKCIFVPVGVPHGLRNDGETPWVLRVTYQRQLLLRHVGRLFSRALRKRLPINL